MKSHLLAAVLLAGLSSGLTVAGDVVRHDVRIVVDPARRSVRVEDRFTPPRAGVQGASSSFRFLLHAGLAPACSTSGAVLRRLDRTPTAADFILKEGRFRIPEITPVELWELTVPQGVPAVSLAYGGVIHHPIEQKGEDYARSFGETPGTVSPDGVVLSGSSLWIPWTGDDPFAFTLRVELPGGWDAISQGARTRHERSDSTTVVVWESPEPQTEIHLVAGQFVETSRKSGRVDAMVFLREKDESLAGRYLEATDRYLKMYERLLGPYPYAKFALVENFWETGYGMPSFTLLGSKVIRLPFIVNTSYPHEILHNWWGNGVYVDYSRGNWCEGLTAYLADHLLQEQSGDASEYRQTTLQKYTDYVTTSNDFPLSAFRERHSPSTEAVGYGKSLMLFHELRRELGDERFVRALRRFYEANRFRSATFDDLRAAFEAESGQDLGSLFLGTVDRAGAPRLGLRGVSSRQEGEAWIVEGVLEQTQPEEPFAVTVPVAITLEGEKTAHETRVILRDRRATFSARVPRPPVRVDVDPAFDVFRRLDPRETPPALTRAFGAKRAVALLPSRAPADKLAAYRALAEDWSRNEPGRIEIRLDTEVDTPPADRAIWIFGTENERTGWAREGLGRYGVEISESRLRLGPFDAAPKGIAFAAVAEHPAAQDQVQAWIAADRSGQVAGLGRKLPHYHKYSFLVFEGDEPVNVAKGRWPVLESPLTRPLAPSHPPQPTLARRDPLATPPPVFSMDRVREAVRILSSPSMEGRAPGTEGHGRASSWIQQAFRDAGLAPAGEPPGSFVASWPTQAGATGNTVTLSNVLGMVRGANPKLARQVVVVGAHFDHLGTRGPEGRTDGKPDIHPGADDNASGVAALLELARSFASGPAPERSILFAVFDGEEAGRLGSKRLVERLARDGIDVRSMVNLDTVGRLGSGKILVLGTGSASEWVHVFRGAGFVTGYPVESVTNDPGGSDQVSFQEAGIPAVQLFTGPHLDYHTARDTADKIDVEGVAKVAAVAREAIDYLAGRPEPLTPASSRPSASGGEPGTRKVSLGTIPDFSFSGPGVRLDGVVPGSPAERAGLAKGDIIVRLGDTDVADLRGLSAALKSLAAGARVRVTYVRNGQRRDVETELAAR